MGWLADPVRSRNFRLLLARERHLGDRDRGGHGGGPFAVLATGWPGQ